MALQLVNIGSTANDGSGDPIRTAFDKVNDNFSELYSSISGVGGQDLFSTITGATGVIAHDCSNNQVFRHSVPAANWTANLTNLNLSTLYATTIVLIVEQGVTGYIPSALQIAGTGQTIYWTNAIVPTATDSGIDVFSFMIYNVAGTYKVLGSGVSFA